MVRVFLLILIINPLLLFSQNDTASIVKSGLLRTQGTFSFGNLPKLKETGIYLHGNLEYYFDSQFSVRGDVFYHLKSDDFSQLKMNHQLFSGATYHFKTGGNFNPYIGIQPGIGLTEASSFGANENTSSSTHSKAVTFIYSSVIGFNYYAEDWFHLFVDARLLGGTHKAEYNIDISEIRLSFGLGFNINTK